jgi:hypothetical protein
MYQWKIRKNRQNNVFFIDKTLTAQWKFFDEKYSFFVGADESYSLYIGTDESYHLWKTKKKDQVTARTTAVGPPCCHRWSGEVVASPSSKWGGHGAATAHSSCHRSPPRSSLDPRR